ncbi:MAG: glycerophosphodiester phosphodiesterase family protein, partial [Planctomycetota bacterium]
MQKPHWISHRGYCGDGAVENSAAAFAAARAVGFRHVETDLRITADGRLVLAHDPSWSRLGGPDTPIRA